MDLKVFGDYRKKAKNHLSAKFVKSLIFKQNPFSKSLKTALYDKKNGKNLWLIIENILHRILQFKCC